MIIDGMRPFYHRSFYHWPFCHYISGKRVGHYHHHPHHHRHHCVWHMYSIFLGWGWSWWWCTRRSTVRPTWWPTRWLWYNRLPWYREGGDGDWDGDDWGVWHRDHQAGGWQCDSCASGMGLIIIIHYFQRIKMTWKTKSNQNSTNSVDNQLQKFLKESLFHKGFSQAWTTMCCYRLPAPDYMKSHW